MNNTKKLTTGAMLLAIVGAVMLIDRQLSFLFQELIVMLAPAIIIIYSAMYDVKDGLILSVSLLIIGFLLGNPSYTFLYMPISVIVGVGYSIGVKKNLDKTRLMLIAMCLFVLGEIIVAFIVTPIIGLSIPDQLTQIKEMYDEMFSGAGISTDVFLQIGINFDSLLLVIFVLSTILMGIAEGFIIHLLSLFLLKRFKIKEFDKGSLVSINLHPIVAYVCFLLFASTMFVAKIENETIKLIVFTLGAIGSIILAYYGYVFCICFIKLKTRRNTAGLIVILGIILLFPISLILLVIFGFLYGSGPFKRTLERLGYKPQ